jgi:uncharacterized membrane protein (Fun14 family)
MVTQGLPFQQPTLMENIKSLNFQGVIENFKSMHINWIEVGMFGAMGLLSGFLFKKYFQMFLICTILGVGLIAGLDHFGMININWNTVHGIVGQAPAQNVDTIFNNLLAWMKINVLLVTSFGVGFFAGLRIG